MKTIKTMKLTDLSASTSRSRCASFSPSRGFTLVEMLVAIFIFSMVMLIAVGSLLSMVDANRKAQTIKAAVNNLSFALDSIGRSIRVGTNFHCGVPGDALTPAILSTARDCAFVSGAGEGSLISFEPFGGNPTSFGDQWVFCRGTGTTCSSTGTAILRSQNGGSSYQSITSPEVTIVDFRFYVVGSGLGVVDRLQPKIVMVVHGYAGASLKTRTEVRLQTTMSPRLLDE